MSDSFTTACQFAHQTTSAFRSDCNQLFQSVDNTAFYQHPEWLISCGTYLSRQTLQLVLVYNQQQPVLLLPASLASERIQLLRHDHISVSDIVVHPSLDESQITGAFACALNALAPNWSEFDALNVPENSVLIKIAQHAPQQWSLSDGRLCAHFDCSTDKPPIPGKLRRNVNRLRKQLESHACVSVNTYTDTASLASALEHFLMLEKSGWKGRGDSTAIEDNNQLREFYTHLVSKPHPDQQPLVTLLQLGEQPIAAQFGLRTGKTLSLLKIAYNEEYAHYSPGSQLLLSVLQEASSVGIETLSLVTAPKWSERWHPIITQASHCHFFNRNMQGQKQKLIHSAKLQVKTIAKRMKG